VKLCAVVVFYRMVVYLGNFKYFCFKNRTNLDSMNNEVKVVLFDTFESFENLLPLSYTRPVADFRVGIMTIREKWEHYLPGNYSYKTTEYLGEKFPVAVSADEEAVFVAGNVLPDEDLAARVLALESGGALRDRSGLVAFRGSLRQFGELDPAESSVEGDEVSRIQYVYDVFRENGQEICRDYDLLAKRGKGQAPDASVTIIGSVESSGGMPRIYIEDGAVVEGAVLNVKNGPIYIGKDAVVMEGACLRGPIALCDNAVVRMGAKVYGSTTIGPYCKVGGELDNAVMFGFSNKAHDGYLGNAVIGEWCNLGAGANASNLKNDYTKIRIWNYHTQRFMRTDLQFCGLIMGDHSKAGINTMFNTATVVGVGVNLHGAGFPRTFIPSFSSGSPEGGFDNVSIDKFMDTAGMVMQRRGLALTDVDRRIFDTIYRSAARFK
jgi:UDP-N-acetylglucosamine diphosphorylase/glucosamine-1-phosphate N-acetyltransferase